MLQSIQNFILVEIEKRFQDQQGGFFVDTTWTPEEYATLEGTVICPPIFSKSDGHRTVLGKVNKGDRIFFSYAIVYEYDLQPSDASPVYRNLVYFNNKEYWKVDIAEVFCKITPEGKYEMVTDNILLDPVHDETVTVCGLEQVKQRNNDTGIVKAVPPNISLSCNMGDVVCFEPRYVQKYNIFGKEHYIIPSRRVLAKI